MASAPEPLELVAPTSMPSVTATGTPKPSSDAVLSATVPPPREIPEALKDEVTAPSGPNTRTVDVPRGPVRSSLITTGLADRIWNW